MIRRLLVAGGGEVARRIFATCRLVGIETVAVHADPAAPHAAVADCAVRLAGAGDAAPDDA
ncbi:MAG TPA: biotin carboxylase N-terminal domain-containing protein, partial [Pilimelia sp.]|nr:biotin carboxylase N-terminal domain-containing protein [Pilimelia sp.]